MMRGRDWRHITDLTRRTIFDYMRVGEHRWYGKLDDVDFLSRVFDLGGLPSRDPRHKDMEGDILRHRVMNPEDRSDDWVFSDGLLDLLHAPDEVFLRFLCEMIHPVVREEAKVDGLVTTLNGYIAPDGYRLAVMGALSGRRLFGAGLALAGADGALDDAARIAISLSSGHVTAQITRMRANIVQDAPLAIGSAKEFVESLYKRILGDRKVAHARGNLPMSVTRRSSTLATEIWEAGLALPVGVLPKRSPCLSAHMSRPNG